MSVTSLEVFMKFVRCVEPTSDSKGTARLDVSGVVSRECFEAWLCSRVSNIKHPEQTFHRILLCHLRGSDTRKPFPPEVEKAIIALLNSDEACALWDRCFQGNPLKVGKHGFRGLGYHETLAAIEQVDREKAHVNNSAEQENFDFDLDTQELRLPSKNDNNKNQVRRLNRDHQHKNDVYKDAEIQLPSLASNPWMNSRYDELFASSHSFEDGINGTSVHELDTSSRNQIQLQVPLPLPSLPGILRSEDMIPVLDESDRLNLELHKCQTPWERLCEIAERMLISGEPEQRVEPVVADFIKDQIPYKMSSNTNQFMFPNDSGKARSRFGEALAKIFARQMFPPAVEYMLRQNIPDEYDKRFDPCFIFPNADQCVFDENKPVGWWHSNSLSGTILEISEEAKVLLKGEYCGMYMYSPLASIFNSGTAAR